MSLLPSLESGESLAKSGVLGESLAKSGDFSQESARCWVKWQLQKCAVDEEPPSLECSCGGRVVRVAELLSSDSSSLDPESSEFIKC